MKIYLLAWRNLWRNKKRTLITVSAVLFAVFLSTFMSSMQEGTYGNMIENTVRFYSGYLQIHDTLYWESKSINDTYIPEKHLFSKVENTPNVTMHFERMESFALISTGENTKAGALIGINPEKEDHMTGLSKWLTAGEYLKENDDGVLIASTLAKQLKVNLGDTVILMGAGYHGASAAALAAVKGILNFPSPKMNSIGVYTSIKKAQKFFDAPDRVTSIVVMVDDYKKLDHTKKELQDKAGNQLKVMTWEEMQPEIVQMIEQDRSGGVIMKAIIYLVIGFGILGTIIMMMSERRKELAIMIALGMHKGRLLRILFFETLYIGLIGVAAGFLLSTPIIAYLVQNPIPLPEKMAEVYEKFGFEGKMFFSFYYPVFLNQVITIFILTLFVFVYPLITVYRFKLIKTLRG